MAWPEDEPTIPTQSSDRPSLMTQLDSNSLFALLLQFISGFLLVTSFGPAAFIVISLLPYLGAIANPIGFALLLALIPFGAVQIIYGWMMYRKKSGSGRVAVIVDIIVIALIAMYLLASEWTESANLIVAIAGMNVVTILLLTMTTARQDFYDI
jgi:predicted lysophospholipase L1 biosynthesis ABC-type transport system permease subunit